MNEPQDRTFCRRDRAGAFAQPAAAATFRLAFQGDLKSLDPYSLNETFTHGMLGNVYEGLTKRDKDLKIMPGLAERWEVVEPTRWRFHLRKGVKFQNGEDFTADDVVFSADRARMRRLRRQDAASRPTSRWSRSTITRSTSCCRARTRSCTPNGTPGTSCRRNGPRRTARPQPQPRSRPADELRGAQRQRHRPVRHHRAIRPA